MASKGYLLGHEDMINDRKYTTSVRCISYEGTVYALKSEEFLERMRVLDKTWDFLVEMAVERDKMTKGKLKQAQRKTNTDAK